MIIVLNGPTHGELIRWTPEAGIVRLILHASPDGRHLYESLGFIPSNEMLFPHSP